MYGMYCGRKGGADGLFVLIVSAGSKRGIVKRTNQLRAPLLFEQRAALWLESRSCQCGCLTFNPKRV